MPLLTPKYSDAQRDSMAICIVERRQGVKVANDAVKLAAAGELENVLTGEKLAAFDMPLTTARAYASAEKKRRSGSEVPAWIRDKTTDEAIDELATRLVGIAAHEVERIMRQNGKNRDLERARKAAQILREARALVRGDAPKQGSAHRKARKGDAPEDGTAAAGAASMVQQLRESKQGASPHETPPHTNGDTNGQDQPTEPHAREDAGGIIGGATSAHDTRRRELAKAIGIDLTGAGAGEAEQTQ